MKQKIADKIKENKLDEEIGDIPWKVLEDSANYSFNKSHSISYAALSAITVYLKFKYPKFFLSLLRMTRHETDPRQRFQELQESLMTLELNCCLSSYKIKDGLSNRGRRHKIWAPLY